MQKQMIRCGRRVGLVAGAVVGGVAGFMSAPRSAYAGEHDYAPTIVRIEEDWELALNEPESELIAPQFYTVMAPQASCERAFFQVTWNFREMPDFQPGGLQVQAWSGEDYEGLHNVAENSLARRAENIRWTQAMVTNGDMVGFAITNGESSSWGSFGGDSVGVLQTSPVIDLNNYDPDFSATKSYVTYGANRVNSLRMREVRWYTEDGVFAVDHTHRIVYRQNHD